MTGAPYSHCSYCGAAYPAEAGWPRVCAACEETGLLAEAGQARLFAVHGAPAGGTMMVFGVLPERAAEDLPPSAPTEEATEWLVVTEPVELAFSTHTRVLADFLAGRPPV
ncbi:hypothetical protein ACFO0M_14310 [Micromonospora mangrovi]|uniref:NUDIX hydrolase n=2 Tax=Micromonospora TaxID=1873 RepID=A0AAU7MEK8_9ACTN